MGNVCTDPPKSTRTLIIEERNKRLSQIDINKNQSNGFNNYNNQYHNGKNNKNKQNDNVFYNENINNNYSDNNDKGNIFGNEFNKKGKRSEMNQTHFTNELNEDAYLNEFLNEDDGKKNFFETNKNYNKRVFGGDKKLVDLREKECKSSHIFFKEEEINRNIEDLNNKENGMNKTATFNEFFEKDDEFIKKTEEKLARSSMINLNPNKSKTPEKNKRENRRYDEPIRKSKSNIKLSKSINKNKNNPYNSHFNPFQQNYYNDQNPFDTKDPKKKNSKKRDSKKNPMSNSNNYQNPMSNSNNYQNPMGFSNNQNYQSNFNPYQNYQSDFQNKNRDPKKDPEKIDYSKLSILNTKLQNGAKYSGQSKYGLPSGKGREDFPNGDYYDGNFQNGKRNGYGVLKFKGTFYKGNFKDNSFDGKGRFVYSDGRVFEGGFSKGVKDGKGVLMKKDGTVIKRGEWIKDVYIGN